MINSVAISNFKNIRDQKIDLERLTVFVGANASGKTSVLEAIHLAVRAATPKIVSQIAPKSRFRPELIFAHEQHCDWLYTRGGDGPMRICCTTPGGEFAVEAAPPLDYLSSGRQLLGPSDWSVQITPEAPNEHKDAMMPARPIKFLRLDKAKLSKATYSDRSTPRIKSDGEGLAATLAYMALSDPDGFDWIVEEMRRMVPQLKRIRFARQPVHRLYSDIVTIRRKSVRVPRRQEFQGDAVLFDFVNANGVAAHLVSEGTLMLLGLLTVLLGPSKPRILLLDDIEHGLHPLAQKTLLEIIGAIMERFPDLQLLATAHSPYLLDCLKPEQVRLMTTDSKSHAICGRLTDHPQFERWKDEMAPGELWSLFGEQWLAEGADRT